MGYLYRFAYTQSFLLKKREQITLLLFFSRPRLLFFFLHHRKKSKQNKQLMLCVGAGTQKEKKKQPPKISRVLHICDQNFSSAFALKKQQSPFLSTLSTRQRKRKKWSRLPKVRALCSFPAALFLSFSLSLLFPCCAFFAFVFFLSLLSKCVCVRVCARVSVCLERPDLRLGVLFPSQPQVFFSCALTC